MIHTTHIAATTAIRTPLNQNSLWVAPPCDLMNASIVMDACVHTQATIRQAKTNKSFAHTHTHTSATICAEKPKTNEQKDMTASRNEKTATSRDRRQGVQSQNQQSGTKQAGHMKMCLLLECKLTKPCIGSVPIHTAHIRSHIYMCACVNWMIIFKKPKFPLDKEAIDI